MLLREVRTGVSACASHLARAIVNISYGPTTPHLLAHKGGQNIWVLAKKIARIAGQKQAYRSRQVHHNSVRRQQGQQLMSMRTLGYTNEHRDRRERISAGRRSPTRSHTAIAAIAAPSPPPISAAQRRRIRHWRQRRLSSSWLSPAQRLTAVAMLKGLANEGKPRA